MRIHDFILRDLIPGRKVMGNVPLMLQKGLAMKPTDSAHDPQQSVYPTIHQAAAANDAEDVSLHLSQGVDVNKRDKEGWTPLHWAGGAEAAKVLIEQGADVNAADKHGYTPLHWVPSTDMVNLLVEHGANVDAGDRDGRTALHWAAYEGYRDLVEALVQAGADVNARDSQGSTPRMAAVHGHYWMIELLEGATRA